MMLVLGTNTGAFTLTIAGVDLGLASAGVLNYTKVKSNRVRTAGLVVGLTTLRQVEVSRPINTTIESLFLGIWDENQSHAPTE